MKRKLGKGKPLEELVKGSLNYTMVQIRNAFRRQFMAERDDSWWPYIEEIFDDHVIVTADDLNTDEFYYVTYDRVDGACVFADREDWEVVELTYQPQTMMESAHGRKQRLVERVEQSRIELLEAQEGQMRRVRAIGITADVVNGNGRRYPAVVLEAAVRELRTHLHESAGQGRMLLLGEAEHPSSKPTRRANILETVVKWESVDFDGRQVILEGSVLPTSKGRDILVLLEGGVMPGISQRAYGKSKVIEEGGQRIEEVLALTITGYDLVVEGSDPEAGVTLFESEEEDEMSELNLEMLKEEYPDLVAALLNEHDAKKKQALEGLLAERQREEERARREASAGDGEVRTLLGLDETADVSEALRAQAQELKALREEKRQREVREYIEGQVADIKYPPFLKEQFVEAVKNAGADTIEEAKKAIVEKRKEYDGIMAHLELSRRGGLGGVHVMGPVIETELGVPAYAAAAYQIQESLMSAGMRRWNARKPISVNEEFAKKYLEAYDRMYKAQLLNEQRRFEEAEQTSDLNIPYSIMRAVIAEAFPELVATSIFDVGMMAESTGRLYYEAYSGETGYTGTVTNEDVTADSGTWVEMDYKRITPGSVTVTADGGSPTYVEGTDYVIDYANGEIMALSGGDISDGASLDVDYTYTAIREGEMGVIQRGKLTLTYKTISAAADRLATQISSEAIKFSRSQLGFDAVTQTLASLVRQVRRKIDQGMLYAALSAALRVSSNIAGTWNNATDDLDTLVKYLGLAKVKVANRYYAPTFYLMSTTNGDRLSNWDGFKRDGFPDAILNANGFVGRVKGLPAFESTEFSDSYFVAGNRELVMHRVYSPMELMGPYPTYDVSGSTSKLVAADQYYAEEYNATEAPVPQKGSLVKVS